MNFKIEVKGSPEARAKLDELKARLSDLSPLVRRVAIMELAQAQGRIEAGGPGWAPTQESSTGTSLNRTGTLLRSLTVGASGNLWEEIPHGLRVGTALTTDTGYNIGAMMQGGTGIYGRGSPIRPINGKFLVFEIDGRKIFAREVKGSPPRPFLYVSDADAKRAADMAAAYVKGQQGAT